MEIDSPLGQASFGDPSSSGQPQRRVFTVSDETEQDVQHPQGYMRRQPPMENSMQPQSRIGQLSARGREELGAKRRKTRTLMESVSPEAKKRIEFLCNLGRVEDEFDVDGTTFEIRSLKGKELKGILLAVADVSPLVLGIELRNQTLARSVYRIDGQTLDLVLGTTDFEAKVSLFDEMDDHTAEYIHSQYQKIAKEAQEKYGIKNAEDVKQVASDIKKS